MLRALGVIPARYASTRFRGKPLAPLGNGTLLEAVWRKAAAAESISRLIVATDDSRIREAAEAFGAEVRMTSPEHASGTDRVAEVLRELRKEDARFELVLNVQGDEPMIAPRSLDRLVACFRKNPGLEMATLCEPLQGEADLSDPNVVKVVTAENGRAIYFSRASIPYRRDPADPGPGGPAAPGSRRHQGIYAYRPDVLERLTGLPPSPLERLEGLEQLRALEAGISIQVIESDFHSIGVDTPEDLERVSALLAQQPQQTEDPVS